MAQARVYTINDLPTDKPMEKIDRRRIIGDQVMISHVRLEKGFTLATHHHENEQFVIVVKGRCLFGIGAEGSPSRYETEVSTGQVLHLPGNVPHSCIALEPTEILDIFSPVSATTGVDRR